MNAPLTMRQYLLIFAICYFSGFILIALQDLVSRYL